MSEMQVEYRRTTDLVPYAANARTHSAAQVAQMVASIREFGFTNPILTDGEGGILAGHGRVPSVWPAICGAWGRTGSCAGTPPPPPTSRVSLPVSRRT